MPWYFVNCARLVVFFLVILLISIEFERGFSSFNLVPLTIGKFWVGGVRMCISVTIKRYRALKEVGKIKMSVGVIAYYNLVQVCQSHQQFYYHPKAVPTFQDQVGDNFMHVSVASAFGTVFPPCAKPFPPLHGIEFQSSEVYPKNFVIFNQTDHRNQIMFNPAVANNLNSHVLNGLANYMDGKFVIKDVNEEEKETSSSLKEDLDDIDALLSSEAEEQEDYDEEVSTARTYGNHESDSDSRSAYGSKPRKNSSCPSPLKSTGIDGFCDPEKRLKMKKMVKVLRGIVPGADEMGSVTVIDEAVRYLKSLKVEAEKLGFEIFMNGD